jgi:arylsulfatase A
MLTLSRLLPLLFCCLASVLCARPNFVIINIDDLGYADIGAYGSKLNRTPHLDRMAAEGMRLTSHYASPVCTPSRASLMTGCYPKRVLSIPSVLFPGAALGLAPEVETVADVLKAKGYATACVGKWHLGDQPEFLPTRQGFDYYYGILYSNDMGPLEEGAKSDLGAPLPERKSIASKGVDKSYYGSSETGLKGAEQPPIPILRNETVVGRLDAAGQQSITQQLTEEAVAFIERAGEKPFLLYLPHVAVHFPIYPGKAFQNKSSHGYYADWVEEVDWSVGCVLDKLRELKLESNTLVFFTSDNGGTHRGSNGPLRGHKGTMWEGGVRVPLLAWWPGKIAAGSTSDEVTGMIDFLPTFAALAGAPLPKEKIDGGDITPILWGQPKATTPHQEGYLFFHHNHLQAIRRGPWKLYFTPEPGKRVQKAKANASDGESPRLYHLENDLGETTNVAASHPEVVSELTALAQRSAKDLGTHTAGPGVRPPGRVDDPQPWINLQGEIRQVSAP